MLFSILESYMPNTLFQSPPYRKQMTQILTQEEELNGNCK